MAVCSRSRLLLFVTHRPWRLGKRAALRMMLAWRDGTRTRSNGRVIVEHRGTAWVGERREATELRSQTQEWNHPGQVDPGAALFDSPDVMLGNIALFKRTHHPSTQHVQGHTSPSIPHLGDARCCAQPQATSSLLSTYVPCLVACPTTIV